MARPQSIDDIIGDAVSKVMLSVMPAIQHQIVSMAVDERKGARRQQRRQGVSRSERRARPRGEEMTKWVADRRARRVPIFVIEMTGGLDTKKRIVAKYGENVAFEKGKPAPKPTK